MQVALEDGTLLRGDFVLRAVQRFDLTPIPSTLELLMRADTTLGDRIAEGSVLLAGSSLDRYRIVKLRRATTEWVQLGGASEVIEVTAILDGFAQLARPAARAIVKEGKSLGEVYRACGSAARIGADLTGWLFTCMAGEFPTVGIARLLQEEAAAPVWGAKGSLSFVRLPDLFTTAPVEALARDTTRAVESAFLEQHEIPWAMSTSTGGGVTLGRRDLPRGFVFIPRAPDRVLSNVTRALVVRRTLTGNFAGHLRAGDGFDVAGARHVITTVAHTWDTGSSGGAPDQSSRVWLAQLQR